jgi:hypothetical protein
MSDGEQVEIQIDSNGTIYKVKKQWLQVMAEQL